ncbi:AAA family ATPase [Streptomyces sp. NPDC020731]|uniref:AAA family ATPase n=1 Tax=Streptomyces sp. NPDC020731 TaxID=3365085 RepID=UPI0037A851C2
MRPDVFNTLLQILYDDRLSDGQGRVVGFRHCVIVMTSGTAPAASSATGADAAQLKDALTQGLRGRFLPEFLDRVDDTIVLHTITADGLGAIVDHLLDHSEWRVDAQGRKLEVTDAAEKRLTTHGHQPEFGARPLRRTIRTEFDNRIADLLPGDEADPGGTVVADIRKATADWLPQPPREAP